MTSTHQVPKKISAIFAILFLLPALYIFGVWLKIYRQEDLSIAQKNSLFTNSFPLHINDVKVIHYLCMAFAIVAIILAAKSFRQKKLFLRIIMMLTVLIGALIFFMNIFQVL